MSDKTDELKAAEKIKLEELTTAEETTAVSPHANRRAGNRPTRPHQFKGNWIPGLVLILVGTVFLAHNLWEFPLHNWWALFILIPALGNFATAYEKYQRAGRWTRAARSAFIWGFFFVAITAAFLFNISWNLMWPVLLILLGLSFLFNR
jgi:hypothetical protein